MAQEKVVCIYLVITLYLPAKLLVYIMSMPTFPGLNEDCSDAILVMLDKATLLHVGSTSRIAFVAVGPHLVKKAVIVGSAAKISAFCSFVLSRRLMCQIRELYIRYTADETQARFVLSTASIATPLAKVLQGAKMLQSFTMREYAIYMFRYEPQLRDLLQKVPSLVSLDIWGPSMTAFDDLPCVGGLQSLSVCMPWKEDPQQYPALARFISTSAETLTQVDYIDLFADRRPEQDNLP
ncbi:hypothetical protein EVG20_g9608 [Dentipellis fragilis]|uniref:Uncharacterized protein n=1 Tax=Dentipellis fragilis TaxID=205917 RepID=A0A4Y9XWQ5_9AGAM|nr:hypothetical protein EVG20_g9608 [Dentipellis fragilis]